MSMRFYRVSYRGFTAIELMIAVLIAALFFTLAIPSFQSFIQNHRAVTLSSDFIAALHLARSEAIRRGGFVSICAASDSTQTACGGAADWGNGWVVFSDSDGNGALASTNDRLSVHQAFAPGAEIDSASSTIIFNDQGMLQGGATSFDLSAPGCVGNNGRVVSLSGTGRVSVSNASCDP